MKIYIDGDGCPVVDLTIKIAKEFNIDVTILCDTAHEIQKENVNTIVVSQGTDSVDFALVNMINPRDIVITQDYGLAAMCLAKEASPINQDGMIYNDDNMNALLTARHAAKKIRMSGGRLKGPKKRKELQNISFEMSLKTLIKQII